MKGNNFKTTVHTKSSFRRSLMLVKHSCFILGVSSVAIGQKNYVKSRTYVVHQLAPVTQWGRDIIVPQIPRHFHASPVLSIACARSNTQVQVRISNQPTNPNQQVYRRSVKNYLSKLKWKIIRWTKFKKIKRINLTNGHSGMAKLRWCNNVALVALYHYINHNMP